MSKGSTDWAVVRAKIKRNTYAQLQNYCKQENLNPSKFIRQLVEQNVSGVIPLNRSGLNRIEYNKENDTYDWFLDFDNGPQIQVAEKIQPPFFENLLDHIQSNLTLRETYLKKSRKESIPVPSSLKKIKGEK